MRKLVALSLGLTLMTGCIPELLKATLSCPSTGTTQPSGLQPCVMQSSGQPGMFSPPPPPKFSQDCVDKFKSIDKNSDGFITISEWNGAGLMLKEADFAAVDLDRDGMINLDDLCKPRNPSPPPPKYDQYCVDKFKLLDKNGDGYITTSEWNGSSLMLKGGDFSAADRNRDNKLDIFELCGNPMDQPPPSGNPSAQPTAAPTAAPTASGDGPTECQTNFAAIDTDDNATATKEEWEAAGRDTTTFDSYDADDDGAVTTEEFCAGS